MNKSVLFIGIFGFIVGLLLTRPIQNPNPTLPVPQVAQISLPPPLAITAPKTNVLGAETFDPLGLIISINAERAKHNIKPLRVSELLMKAAKMRADILLKYQNFSHQDPYEHIELITVLPMVNYHFVYAGENIGMGGGSADDFTIGFMASTYHREMLLRPDLVDTGAAIVTGPYKQYYVNYAVQLFAIPGGEDEMLGYSANDKMHFEEQLAYITNQLSPLRWLLGKTLQKNVYSDARFNILTRQKLILSAIVKRMEKKEQLDNNDALLVLEYNRLSGHLSQDLKV